MAQSIQEADCLRSLARCWNCLLSRYPEETGPSASELMQQKQTNRQLITNFLSPDRCFGMHLCQFDLNQAKISILTEYSTISFTSCNKFFLNTFSKFWLQSASFEYLKSVQCAVFFPRFAI
jgi:hypothetical protein